MKNTHLLFIIPVVLLSACKKKDNTIPTTETPVPKVQVQTEHRISRLYTDSASIDYYSYNDDKLVSSKTHYYGPTANLRSNAYYTYDEQWRVSKSAEQPIEQAEEYNTYKYNEDLRPIARYSSKYQHPLEEYDYTDGKITERRYYYISGELMFTEKWTYNSDGNAETYVREYATTSSPYQAKKVQIYFTKYDNAPAWHTAIPGIHDILLTGDFADINVVSKNNVLKYTRIVYAAGGSTTTTAYDIRYKYNSAGYPVERIIESTINEVTSVLPTQYFEYAP